MRHQLLKLLHLASPALPIGAFHFSQGLESAVDRGWVRDEASAREWIEGLSRGALGSLDLPVLARLHAAWCASDRTGVARWNAFLLASRETEELRAEDRHLGAALLRVLAELEIEAEPREAAAASFLRKQEPGSWSHAAMFALACARWNVAADDTLQTYAWTWTENQVLAAIKLIPLGQSAGQRILFDLSPRLAALAARALTIDDEDIGVAAVMQAFASARHETQYSRLFRS